MKTNYKMAVVIAFIFSITALGCTSIALNDARVNVEKIPSSYAHFYQAVVSTTESSVTVSGILHKQYHSRTSILGHVDIVFVSPDRDLLKMITTDYRRRSFKSRRSEFRVEVPLAVPDGSTVYVLHHIGSEALDENDDRYRDLINYTNLHG